MSSFQPLVSVIVPCYKQAHFLDQSLRSVLDQTYNNWECIIVDDGSPDDTEHVALKWITKDERFKYLKQKNKGLSGARNAGIEICEGEYILPLDADDVLDKQYLETLVPELLKQPEAAVISCYTKFFHGNTNTIVGELKPESGTVKSLLYQNQLVASSLYKKEHWTEVGGYDESMKNGFEDWDFWLSVTKRGYEYHIIPKSLFYYRKATQSMLVKTIQTTAEGVKEYIIHKHRDIYIEDFDNCVKVFTHHLVTCRKKEQCLQQSLEYKLGKLIMKPFKLIGLFKDKITPTK
jgi:glycosyltransferase involved in cell wall biosynthesis